MIERQFVSASHFFEQISVFALTVTTAYLTVSGGPIKSLADGVVIGGNVVGSILMDPQGIVHTAKQESLITAIVFEEQTDLSAVDYPKEGAPPFGPYLKSLASVCLGSAYESVKPELEAKYSTNPRTWHPLLQYFRHLRNACFHGNRFRITPSRRGLPATDPNKPPKWRSSEMMEDGVMNGSSLFFDWLRAGDLPILLADIDELLQQDGIQPSIN